MGECPLCGESTSKPSTRLIKESCGHSKCRLCLLNEESGCSVCEGGRGDISLSTIESIGNFDYRLPATTIPNYEELDTSPRKLDFNKIPDAFNDCHLDVERLAIDNSIALDSNNVAKAPGPLKVDISTETEDIVEEEEEEEVPPQPPLSVQRNTAHPSLPPQVTQPSPQPVQTPQPKIPEVFANTVRNNHITQQETPIVQNAVQNPVQNSFIPVTQRADGRQFITIAFIANNSPNKNQHVVTTPILNQCLPAIGNMATVQRPGGNQCIPVLGNLNALQNPAGGQFIIRNSNIVQNLMGNQSIPIIGNMNAMQNLTGPPGLTMMGNVNATKNIAANQPLPSFATVNAIQPQAKGQSFSTTGNPNLVQNVVGNQPYQATQQAVPKAVENQPAPAQETIDTPRKQTRTRGLPRIKTVKNVNIVQKSLPNQSDKVSSKVEKSPVKGRRQRKELPVYLVPRKPNEKAKNVPGQSPTHLANCMSPEYKLEDYLLFNNQQKINNAATIVREMQTETKVTTHTQVLNKPSESVINESPIVSDQYNSTVMQEKIVENKVHERQGQVPNDVSKDEKNLEGLGTKTAEFNENQDLNVIFNIRDENKQIVNEEIGDEREKLKVPNGETCSKEEYQNLDALFDIIEKESKKLNGGIFNKEIKHDLNEGKQADMPDLDENVDNEEDVHSVLDQTVDSELNQQNKEIKTLNNDISDGKDTSGNLTEINHEQVQSVIEGFPDENSAMQPFDKKVSSQVEKQNVPSTEMECEEQETETLHETKEYQNPNGEVSGDTADSSFMNGEMDDDKETRQILNEKIDPRKEDTNVNEELCHEKEVNQRIEEDKGENHCIEREKEGNQCNKEEIPSKEEDNSHDENESNGNKVQYVTDNTDNKEKIHQTLYEDISDVENDIGESNSETPELQATSAESNDGEISCHCSDENTVEYENRVLNSEIHDQEEESNQNEMIEAHQQENASSPSVVNDESSPPFEANDPDSNELDVSHQNEQSGVTEKPQGSPENSLLDEQSTDVENPENNFKRTLPTFKWPAGSNQEDDLSEQHSDMHVENEEHQNSCASETTVGKENQMLETEVENGDRNQTHEGEEDESLVLTETQKSEEKIPDSVVEDELPIVKRRGRKKKSFSDYELDCKPKASSKNQTPGVKRPRGRPKKSLSNLELPNDQQLNSSQENIKSTLLEKERERESFGDESVMHDGDEESSVRSSSAIIKNDDHTDPAIVNKKPRGRPKTKNLHGNDQPIVKKPRGRPKKSLSNLEQSDVTSEAELSIATESSMLADKTSDAISDDPQLDERNERVPETDGFGRDSSVDMEQKEEILHSVANTNEFPVVVKKPRGRPKKSLSSCEPQSQPEVHDVNAVVVKKPIGRSKKSLSNVEQPPERDLSQEKEQPMERDISREIEHSIATEIDDEEDKGQRSEDEENLGLDREISERDEITQNSSVAMDVEQQESPHSKVDEGVTVGESSDLKPSTTGESEQVVKKARGRPKKKPRGRPKKSLSSLEQPIERDVSQETEHSVVSEIADTESQDQRYDERSEDEESQVFDQDETSQYSRVAANDEERESLHSETTSDFVLTDKVDSEAGEESNAADEQPVVVKKPRGRPRKSLSSDDREDEAQMSDTNVQPEVGMNDEERESRHLDVNNDATVADHHDLDTGKQSNAVSDNEQPIAVKKPRGRPKKSLSSCDQEGESVVNDTNVQPQIETNHEEQESLHSNTTFINHAETKSNTIDEHPITVKKSRGRPKKSLSGCDREIESVVNDTNVQPQIEMNHEEKESLHSSTSFINDSDAGTKSNTVDEQPIAVKKPRGRPKKSLSSCDQEIESVVNDTIAQPQIEINHDEKESFNSSTTFTNHSDIGTKSNTVDEHPIAVKKPRGRPKKSLSSNDRESEFAVNDTIAQPQTEINHEKQESLHSSTTHINDSDAGTKSNTVDEHPITVKKPRGRPKKSLSSCDREIESIVNDTIAQPQIETNQEDQESLHSNTTFINDTDAGTKSNTVDEHPITVKKPRGRPKKSLSSCDRENVNVSLQPEVEMNDQEQESLHSHATFNDSDAGKQPNISSDNEYPTVAKKPRGRPKKSLSSCDRDNESNIVDGTSIQPEVKMNDEEPKSQQLNINTDTTIADNNDSDTSKKSNTVIDNEPSTIVKKPRGRPKKSLSNCEISQPEVQDVNAIVIKKPSGRPKKSLSGLEQSDVPSEISVQTDPSVLDENTNDEEDKAQNAENEDNEVLDQGETSLVPSVAADEEERESLHSELIASSTFIDEVVSEVGEKSSTAEEHAIVAKKPRGRPKKSLSNCEQQSHPETHDDNAVVVKKSRGRPKKYLSNLEQPTERDPSPEKEQPAASKVSELCDENKDEEDRAQCSNGTNDGEEIQPANDEVDDLDDTLETSNASVHTEQDETLDSGAEVNEPCNESSVGDQLDTTRESEQLIKKGRGRPKKIDAKKPRGRPKKSSYEQHPDESVQEEVSREVDEKEEREGLHLYDAEERSEEIDNQERANEDLSSEVVSTPSQESVEAPQREDGSPISQEEESQDLKDDENKENKEKYSDKDDVKVEHETSATEQDLEKTPKADVEATKNNTTGRKYKSFDKINTQVIVENGKRKRKPKVLLYENEDLEISTSRKRKKDESTLPHKNDSRKSFEKTQVENPTNVNESSSSSEQVVKSTEAKVKKPILRNPILEIPPKDTVQKLEDPIKNENLLPADENSMDTVNSDISTTVSSHNENEKSSTKRHRRPKVLLYENEDLTIAPKSIKKRKVEFQLPTNENSMDSNHDEADVATDLISTEDIKVESPKKSERVRKAKTLLHENERLTPVLSMKKHLKFQLTKEDLALIKRFNIKLEPVVVLERLTDLSFVNSSKKSKPRKSRKDPTVLANKIRGRAKKTAFNHIKKLSDDPPLYECKVCKESFRTYSIRKFHANCAIKSFQCQYCPRKFKTDTHRLYHERGHTGDKPFGCDLCGRRFVMKYKLNRHMVIHKCLPDLECNECGRKFVSKENLKSHLISHVKSSFVFACNHCPKSFSLDSNRKRHELSHSRNKEYACNYCEQQFGRYDNYSRHMRHHHPDEDPMSVRPSESINGRTPEADAESSSSEEKRHQRTKDQSTVKPKKISRSSSNSTSIPISFSQTLTPQPAPAPYSISQNHDLASVIRETLPDLNNAVPVISAVPVSAQPSSSLMDPIPLEQALVLNRQIEEKMYTQSSFCEFPGLTRRNVTVVNRRQSYSSFERRSSSESNTNSNDGTSFLTVNQERYYQQQGEKEMNAAKKDIHVHWRRRTAETLKSKMDQNN